MDLWKKGVQGEGDLVGRDKYLLHEVRDGRAHESKNRGGELNPGWYLIPGVPKEREEKGSVREMWRRAK